MGILGVTILRVGFIMFRVITRCGSVVTEWPSYALAVISMDRITDIWPRLMFVTAPTGHILASNNADHGDNYNDVLSA